MTEPSNRSSSRRRRRLLLYSLIILVSAATLWVLNYARQGSRAVSAIEGSAVTAPIEAEQITGVLSYAREDNLLASENGAQVIRVPSNPGYADRLIDGIPRGGWLSAEMIASDQSADIIFRLPAEMEVASLLIQPQISKPGASAPQELELLVAANEDSIGFVSLGRFHLLREAAWQRVRFAPHRATFLKLRIHSIYGSGLVGLGEVAAFAPGLDVRAAIYRFDAAPAAPLVEMPAERASLASQEGIADGAQAGNPAPPPIPEHPPVERRSTQAGASTEVSRAERSQPSRKLDEPAEQAPQAADITVLRSSPLPTPPARLSEPEKAPDSVTGIPEVLDTGTLMINRVMVRLYGVEGTLEPYAANLTAYIRHREVSCTRYGEDTFKCLLDAVDLSELVLLNGAGKSSSDAPENLRTAEQQARDKGVGMWQ